MSRILLYKELNLYVFTCTAEEMAKSAANRIAIKKIGEREEPVIVKSGLECN